MVASPTLVPDPNASRSATDRASGAASRAHGLDALRAVAAGMVIVCHLSSEHMIDFGPWAPVVESGRHGVQVFFVLSGYLLVLPFLRGPVDLRAYGVRRIARILPAYLVAMLSITLLLGAAAPAVDPLRTLVLLQERGAVETSPMPVVWSLQIEVVYYLALPILMAALAVVAGRDMRRIILWLVVAGMASWLLGHVSWLHASPSYTPGPWAPLMFPAELWAFVPGMVVATLAVRDAERLRRLDRRWVACIGLVLLGISFTGRQAGAWEVATLDVAAAIGTALLLPWAIRRQIHVPRSLAVLAFLGAAVSYPIYLWHVDLIRAARRAGLEGVTGASIAVGAAVVIACLSWYLAERPALRVGEALVRRLRAGAPQPGTVPTHQPPLAAIDGA